MTDAEKDSSWSVDMGRARAYKLLCVMVDEGG
jgi:hypothetical protein